MPRKKGGAIQLRTLFVRVPIQCDEDIRTAAETLGLDVSNMVRLVLMENIATYIERGLDAKRRAQSARSKAKKLDNLSGSMKKKRPNAKAKPEVANEPERFLDL